MTRASAWGRTSSGQLVVCKPPNTTAGSATQNSPSALPSNPLEAAEREVIETALDRANGVIARAAAELGLSRQALYRRMERLGISIERTTARVVTPRSGEGN
jgi:DNA-binding NtrC family response regulator